MNDLLSAKKKLREYYVSSNYSLFRSILFSPFKCVVSAVPFCFILLFGILPVEIGAEDAVDSFEALYGEIVPAHEGQIGILYTPRGEAVEDIIATNVRSFWTHLSEYRKAEPLAREYSELDGKNHEAADEEPKLLSLLTATGKLGVLEQLITLHAELPLAMARIKKVPSKKEAKVLVVSKDGKTLIYNVRMGRPKVSNGFATVRCRIQGRRLNLAAWLPVTLYFIQQDANWLIDAVDITWQELKPISPERDLEVFSK